MNCEETTKLMDGYLDGELDPITNQAIEQHLRECHNCDQAYKTQRSLIRAIGNATPYYKAPSELRERIQSSLRKEIAEQSNGSGIRGRCSAANRKRARRVTVDSFWNLMELASSRRCHRFCSRYRLECSAPIAATSR